jgi:heme A synthase
VHIFLGIVLLLMSLLVTVRMKDQGTTVKNLSVGLSVIMVIQLFIGFILVFVGLPELIQLIHLWLASLTIGVILILYTATAYERSNA